MALIIIITLLHLTRIPSFTPLSHTHTRQKPPVSISSFPKPPLLGSSSFHVAFLLSSLLKSPKPNNCPKTLTLTLIMALSSPFSSSLHSRHFSSSRPRLKFPQNTTFLPITRHSRLHPAKSIKFDRILTSPESDITDGFFEAISELERMVRDPSDVLNDMIERLSSRELQLVLVYFSQEGRDSYCALEVFDWLKKENRVDVETMELMVTIVCGWIERLVEGEHEVEEVVGLLDEMECVGVDPGFSMVEKVVALYWERGKRAAAVRFVKSVMGKAGTLREGDNERGGAVGYLVWKMMVSNVFYL